MVSMETPVLYYTFDVLAEPYTSNWKTLNSPAVRNRSAIMGACKLAYFHYYSHFNAVIIG